MKTRNSHHFSDASPPISVMSFFTVKIPGCGAHSGAPSLCLAVGSSLAHAHLGTSPGPRSDDQGDILGISLGYHRDDVPSGKLT